MILSHNYLSEIQSGSFNGLAHDLSNNKLTCLDSSMFVGLVSLKNLYIDQYKFYTLYPFMESLSRPLQIRVTAPSQTPAPSWYCDARLCWLREEELAGRFSWHKLSGAKRPVCFNGVWEDVDKSCSAVTSSCKYKINFFCYFVFHTKNFLCFAVALYIIFCLNSANMLLSLTDDSLTNKQECATFETTVAVRTTDRTTEDKVRSTKSNMTQQCGTENTGTSLGKEKSSHGVVITMVEIVLYLQFSTRC